MNNKRATKRALLTSVMALVMCVVMLVGTTFAWFTDTASTGVNKIQAGNLDVDIIGEDGKSLDGKSLSFVKAGLTTDAGAEIDPNATTEILWEPGCRYLTQGFKIANKGNLALKWKAVVNKGTTAANEDNFDLLDVIDFYLVRTTDVNDMGTALGEFSDSLKAKTNSDVYYIKGVMKTSAGNDYQGLTLDGITITVYATQDTVENDSFDNQYDANATYYPVIDLAGLKDAIKNGGNVAVDADVEVSDRNTYAERTIISKPTTLQLNKKITSPDNMGNNTINFTALIVAADTTINAGENGGIDTGVNGAYAINVLSGANLVINGGTYYGGGTAVQVEKGTVTINGGHFAVEPFGDPYGYNFLLNCIDSAYKDGTAKIIVKGGTFVNFNPADCKAEGAGTNFVADGYSVISEKHGEDTWYTVVKGTGVVPGNQADLNNGITQPDAATPSKDVTVVMPTNSSFTLDSGIAHEGAKSRDVTFIGDGSQTVDVAKNAPAAEGAKHLNYQRGSTFTFENLTIENGTDTYDGIVCDELTYKNCTIKGVTTLYGKATFINCTFENTMANQYSIWTWGGTDVTFEGCTFNTNGKAILLYGQATEAKPTNLVVNNCIFNDRNNGTAGKAAIEIGNDYNATYTLTVNNATVNGFADGKNTGSKLWANKNSMDAAHLTVTIDGNKVQ